MTASGSGAPPPPGAQEAFVANDPERYFRPPYVGGRGWQGVYLDVPVDRSDVAQHVAHAQRQVAPRALIAKLDPVPLPQVLDSEAT